MVSTYYLLFVILEFSKTFLDSVLDSVDIQMWCQQMALPEMLAVMPEKSVIFFEG